MRVVTFGIPGLTVAEIQAATGLTDEEMFNLEQKHLQQREVISYMHDRLKAWDLYHRRSEKRYRKLYTLVHRLLRTICSHYGLTRKYELQDLGLSDADPVLSAAWDVAALLDMRTLPR